ncbi:MAG: ATP-binding protein [Tenericutes bacterium]|nr:ATP-binding protein [Mycoplasmatota bacterium]
MKQLLILSGKGGTGKTTIASSFIELSKARAFADCDVEAPNLHLLKHEGTKISKPYFGMKKAIIDQEKCIQCGLCKESCNFNSISFDGTYTIDEFGCEGCSVCEFVCPVNAIKMVDNENGEMTVYKGNSVFSTAELKMGSGNSGKLVIAVKNQLEENLTNQELTIIDGSPGIGCPVIASLSGVDMVLIVAEPSLSGISDMERIIKTARIFQVKIAVCVNKFDTNIALTRKIENYILPLDIDYVGKIPYDKLVTEFTNRGKMFVDEDLEVSKAVKSIYKQTIKILNS